MEFLIENIIPIYGMGCYIIGVMVGKLTSGNS